jgi:hypothetical protein
MMLTACELVPENNDNGQVDQNMLTPVTFDFNIYKPQESCDDPVFDMDAVFRYNLNIYPLDKNNEPGDLLYCASVQRLKRFYEFMLEPGKYQYEAAIICTGWGDACQNMGFPAGNLLWDVDQFEVVADSSITIVTEFR